MTSLRKQLQDKQLKNTIALAMVISILASALSVVFSGRKYSKANAVVKVNNKIITAKEFQRNYVQNYQLKEQVKQQYGDFADFILRYYGLTGNLEQVTIDNLVKEKLFLILADDLGIEVSSRYLENKLSDLAFLIKSNNPNLIPNEAITASNSINAAFLNEHLKRIGMTAEEFDEQVKDILKKDLVLKLINQSVAVPKLAIKQLYIQKDIPRTYSVVKLSLDNYIEKAKNETVFEKDIVDYYKEHLGKYKTQEKRNAAIWEFNPEDFNIKLNPKEIEKYYEANKEDFAKESKSKEAKKEYKSLTEVKTEIEKILKLKKFIKQFALQASRAISSSGKNNAVIKSFINNKKGKEQQVQSLVHDGSIKSNKIFGIKRIDGYAYWTDQDKGYIAKLENIEESKVKDLDQVKDEIKEALYNKKAKEMMSLDLKNAYQELNSKELNNKDIKKIAEKLKVQVDTYKLNPKEQKEITKLKEKNLPIDTMLQMTVKNSSYYVVDKDGYLILLTQVDNINDKEFKEKEKELYNQLKNKFENVISSAYLAYLQKNAKIESIGLAKKK